MPPQILKRLHQLDRSPQYYLQVLGEGGGVVLVFVGEFVADAAEFEHGFGGD